MSAFSLKDGDNGEGDWSVIPTQKSGSGAGVVVALLAGTVLVISNRPSSNRRFSRSCHAREAHSKDRVLPDPV